MTLDTKILKGFYSRDDIVFAVWVGDTLKIGIGAHRLDLDKDEGERLWDYLGGNLPDSDAVRTDERIIEGWKSGD